MNFSHPQITVQDVPNEISLAISISGCPLKCKKCHSKFTWNPNYGEELTTENLDKLINKYITCILFYGGEWCNDFEIFLKYIKEKNLKICLYTGLEFNEVPKNILKYLDYLKTGRYIEEFGGLNSPNTNQKFLRIKDGEIQEYIHTDIQIF